MKHMYLIDKIHCSPLALSRLLFYLFSCYNFFYGDIG